MGSVEVGGNGSVDWRVDVDDRGKPGKKRANAFGYDDKLPGEFTVTIDFNDSGLAAKAWEQIRSALAALGPNSRRLVIRVPYEAGNPDQIKIEW